MDETLDIQLQLPPLASFQSAAADQALHYSPLATEPGPRELFNKINLRRGKLLAAAQVGVGWPYQSDWLAGEGGEGIGVILWLCGLLRLGRVVYYGVSRCGQHGPGACCVTVSLFS